MAVDFSHVGSFRIEFGLILQTLSNDFKVDVDDEGNLEWVLPTMEFHRGIFFRHIYPYHFVVYAISEVLVPGPFTVKSLEAVQAEVLSFLTITIAARE